MDLLPGWVLFCFGVDLRSKSEESDASRRKAPASTLKVGGLQSFSFNIAWDSVIKGLHLYSSTNKGYSQ
ncbi:hypothetical protein GUJ93_ZPchr0004g38406 [Zizania palustris]|uniref:Uncharacterized protein n=1 Tax=Zizania palustris TaxID=103762 RepID=A0A8J5SJK1_ZIZPA|nr:hypothetical protein GUJ93_ZPchr0004g38406 [Zizania palustris]